jgi:soluble lytic murein transglycosylase
MVAAAPAMLLAGTIVEPAPAPPPPPTDPAPAAALVLPPVDKPYQAAAVSIRRRDFVSALQNLERISELDGAAGRHARLVAGLYAHSLERPAEAAVLLGEEPEVPGPLEDWRLWVLADSSAATGEPGGGLAALERLLADWPDSPLAPRAAVRAVELARDAGRPQRALALLAAARHRELGTELQGRLERTAWELGLALGREDVLAGAAERLLTELPLVANELGVADRFAVHRLPSSQLLRRAESLLRAGVAADAGAVLAAVPDPARSLDWHLAMARVLTETRRGDQALELLAPLAPPGPEDRARLAFARARAALEQAQARSGGKGAAAARARRREQALTYLDEAARLSSGELAGRALRLRFEEQVALERIDAALASLRRLRQMDPEDATGTRFLWERGWREYRDRNYTGAIGYWSELTALAPRDRFTRGARYWSARAFEALGEADRARALYAELAAADTTDFYRRHALRRIGPLAGPIATATLPPEGWPSDPLLARARYLTDVGLDALAGAELELLAGRADERSREALAGLLLARAGQPRKSMERLRAAFPALGTPLQSAVPAAALELYYPLHYRDVVERWSEARGVPVPLVLGIIRQESAFDDRATSWAGARGLMQLMPRTAQELAGKLGVGYSTERLYDPDYSVRLGTYYFAQVMQMFDGNVELALAGYNSGPYRLKRLWREAPRQEVDSFIEGFPLEEPKTYVKRILVLSDSYSRLYPELSG